MQPQIILLREGTDQSQGKGQLVSNINACNAVAEVVKSTLGPRGMDKLMHDEQGQVTISNDGATIMKTLDIVHPAASSLVDIAKSQDAEVGDGTTTVVLLACELLKEARVFIEDGVHPQTIVRGYRVGRDIALDKVRELARDSSDERAMLERCAAVALNSKLISQHKAFFAPMIVDAVLQCAADAEGGSTRDVDLNMIGRKKVQGGSATDSFLVRGVAFKKTFSYAGFEQQPKSFDAPKLLLLNVELELKSEKENAEIRISDPAKYQEIVDAEWKIIYDKLDQCIATGAKIVLSKLPIGDLATQYFADHDIFCAGRVPTEDMERVAKATGGVVQTTTNGVPDNALGACGRFEERQIGDERYNLFTDCPASRTATLVLRGGAQQFIEETERSVYDALMIVKRALKHKTVVAGGGAIEMECSRTLREHARAISGKQQFVVNAYARALEVIPRTISENAGFDSTDIMNRLRQKHARDADGAFYGVDVDEEGVCDTYAKLVWEPAMSKLHSFAAATEAACLVLTVDETVRNPASEKPDAANYGGGRGGGGRGNLSAAMGGGGMMGMGQQMLGRGGRGRGIRAMKGMGGK